MKRLQFDEGLEKIIAAEVSTTSDMAVLDSPDFDPTQYINSIFPTEQSLTNLDGAINRAKGKINRLEQEIRRAIRDQVGAGSKGKQSLEQAKKDISDLYSRINDIQKKAESSEKMVTDLVKDIKTLDIAKKNLSATVTTLKRLNMLLSALQQLEDQRSSKNWNDCAKLMEAVCQLSESFLQYKHISKVQEVFKRIDSIRESLKSEIQGEFSKYLAAPYGVENTTELTESCAVIDALDKDSRRSFLIWFCQQEFAEYNRVFKFGEEGGKFENIERRFTWFRTLLSNREEKVLTVFPSKWEVGKFLVAEFCALTGNMITEVLSATHSTVDARTLYQALKVTLDFEKEMSVRFNAIISVEEPVATKSSEETEDKQDEKLEEASLNPRSLEAIRQRYKEFKKTQQPKQVVVRQVSQFQGLISGCYEPFMDIYLRQEELDLQDLINEKMKAETWSLDEEEQYKYLSSAQDLISYFKARTDSFANLTKKGSFLELFKVFVRALQKYTQVLSDHIPPTDAKLSEKEAKTVCLIVNTGEYLSKNSQGLARKFQTLIEPALAEKINAEEAQKNFEELSAKAMATLNAGLENNLEPALAAMRGMAWRSWDEVGDQSEYVNTICATVQGYAPVLKTWLFNKRNFDFFCDSFSSSFPEKLMANVFKCKRISEVGVQQLMLDFNVIKSLLLELPQDMSSSRYANRVKKRMQKIELLLKVIGSNENTIVESYQSLISNGTETELKNILELRGVGDKQSLIKEFKAKKSDKEKEIKEKENKEKGISSDSKGGVTPTQSGGLAPGGGPPGERTSTWSMNFNTERWKNTLSEGYQKVAKSTINTFTPNLKGKAGPTSSNLPNISSSEKDKPPN